MAKHTVKESLAGTAVSYCRAENLEGNHKLEKPAVSPPRLDEDED